MKTLGLALALILAGSAAWAQTSPAQAQLEAGQFAQALETLAPVVTNPGADPHDHYIALQAAMRLNQPELAQGSLDALAGNAAPEWRGIGESVRALIHGQIGEAIAGAERAVAANDSLFAAHYQLGLARARAEDWSNAAAAFERSLELNPSFAYAAYYAGLAYSKINRADRTAAHFERFLRMAPEAPERAGVQSTMRTLRGR
jgi:tetratricopeptide (TPR) repeat protein